MDSEPSAPPRDPSYKSAPDRLSLWVFRGLIVFYVLVMIRIAFEVDWSKW